MSAVDVQYIGQAVFGLATDGIVIWQVLMLPEVVLLVEFNGSDVGGQDVEVDGLAVGALAGGEVGDEAIQESSSCRGGAREAQDEMFGETGNATPSETQEAMLSRRWASRTFSA